MTVKLKLVEEYAKYHQVTIESIGITTKSIYFCDCNCGTCKIKKLCESTTNYFCPTLNKEEVKLLKLKNPEYFI